MRRRFPPRVVIAALGTAAMSLFPMFASGEALPEYPIHVAASARVHADTRFGVCARFDNASKRVVKSFVTLFWLRSAEGDVLARDSYVRTQTLLPGAATLPPRFSDDDALPITPYETPPPNCMLTEYAGRKNVPPRHVWVCVTRVDFDDGTVWKQRCSTPSRSWP